MINMQLIAFLAIGSLIISDILHVGWLQVQIELGVVLMMLYMGYRKLSNME